jgi:hypothetical protein
MNVETLLRQYAKGDKPNGMASLRDFSNAVLGNVEFYFAPAKICLESGLLGSLTVFSYYFANLKLWRLSNFWLYKGGERK